jgi:aminoglycoside phosphotransferase (APT) family kinase protein
MPVVAPGARVLAALVRHGLQVRACRRLPSTRAVAWRLLLDDGRSVRLRRLPDSAAAARIDQCLRAATPGVLPASLGRVGCWLATEYVPGHPAAMKVGRARARAAAARLMAAIHASPHPAHRPTALSVYLRAITLATGRLLRIGQLSRAQAARLREADRPRVSAAALTHGDLSLANLVVTGDGRIRAVDEERVAVRPLAYDLARAVCLWQASADEERRYLEAYERAGGDAAPYRAFRTFWIASALSTSVLYRMRYRPSALPPVVRAIRALRLQ